MSQVLEFETFVTSIEEVLRGEAVVPAGSPVDLPFDIRDGLLSDKC